MMVTCYLGLGSNLGNRQENIKAALIKLRASPKINVEKVSSLYETEAEGAPAGRLNLRFLNGAAKIKTSLSPLVLLEELKKIEKDLGRIPRRHYYPREIDLDILFYGNKKITSPRLKIPHPQIEKRGFVITPLKEIAPRIIKSLSKQITIISNIARMTSYIRENKSKNKTIGFVPTMGCLHRGHLSLIRQAKKDNDICVVSIFVNPAQFGLKEDYSKYPRDIEKDSILAKSAGCDVIFYPKVKDIYPRNFNTYVSVEGLTKGLCGLSRPGHFRGVTTIVAKLFNIIRADIAYFGSKDYQQALVVKKMARDLNMGIKIWVMPTIREVDGLALSSRNKYLNEQQRKESVVLYQALREAKIMVRKGAGDSEEIIKRMKEIISSKKSARIDYIAVVDPVSLEPIEYVRGKALIALAVYIGTTRLIDNITVGQ